MSTQKFINFSDTNDFETWQKSYDTKYRTKLVIHNIRPVIIKQWVDQGVNTYHYGIQVIYAEVDK